MPNEDFEDVEFQLDIESAPEEIFEWARRNIGENDKDIKLYEFREMIFERGDVEPHRTDDAYLLKFLRARNFNLESAYQLLINYYNFKEENPQLFKDFNLLELAYIGDKNIIQVPPYRDQTQRRGLIYQFGNWDPSVAPIDHIFRATLIILELGCLEPRAQILGGVCIFDFENISISHAWQITPSVAKRVVQIMVTSFPLKINSVHIVFESKAFDLIYNIFKPFLSSKMKQKIFFHGSDMESLHKYVEPKYLPKKYGGIRPEYRCTKWFQQFLTQSNSRILKELNSLGYAITLELLAQFKFSEEESSSNEKSEKKNST